LFELFKAAPTDLASAIRDGGGVTEWLWKEEGKKSSASLSAELHIDNVPQTLRYRLDLGAAGDRLEVLDEAVENARPHTTKDRDVHFYYRFRHGHPVINTRQGTKGPGVKRRISRTSLDPQQSVLSQRKDPDLYPEITTLSRTFTRIVTFREWSFGRYTPLREPQPADLPSDLLLPDGRNLGLVLNSIENSDVRPRLHQAARRFLPRFLRFSTLVAASTVQIFLHEEGLKTPIPATRLSDGTLRFIALLTIQLRPEKAPLICIEEPELGLHPDAVAVVADLLVEAAQHTQIVVTTHSDALVSAFTEHAESVIVCENLTGRSQLRRLESDRLQFWLNKYRLGEVWRIGELGGNP
jgi:predicted ATPase